MQAAWNGREALEFVEAARDKNLPQPDIILMDVQMPVIDGYRCTHILRHHTPYKKLISNVPIVAMTASAIQGDREKCTQAGMDDYLAKPVTSKTLEKMLVRWSKNRRKMIASAASDCSESVDYCVSPDIPSIALQADVNDGTTTDSRSTAASVLEDQSSHLLTPKPLLKNDLQEINPFPFGITQHTRQLDPTELAIQLRDDKLLDAAGLDAAGSHIASKQPPTPGLNEGDSLTKENVEKLEREGSRGPVSKR